MDFRLGNGAVRGLYSPVSLPSSLHYSPLSSPHPSGDLSQVLALRWEYGERATLSPRRKPSKIGTRQQSTTIVQ